MKKNNDLIFHDTKQILQNELPIAALYLVLSIHKTAQQNAQQSNDPCSPWHNANAWRLNEATHINLS